ncbi:hypothetical protein BC835DRAFT_1337853 [Cytidiella melzeri]|nr:hypothetical protein BC835DRAFT_1337853 [Cytidiella melzeri]
MAVPSCASASTASNSHRPTTPTVSAMSSKSLSISIVNAFTTDVYRGNPAGIVFVDEQQLQDAVLLQNIAKNLNQPMIAFLHQVPDTTAASPDEVTFDVRWFTVVHEQALCGHATIASSSLLFSTPGLIDASVKSITYNTRAGITLTARKTADGWIELTLPVIKLQPLPTDEAVKNVGEVIGRALGKEVRVKYAGAGVGGFADRLFVEVDADDDLAGCIPKPNLFVETGYNINIITAASKDPDVVFVSRMFAPLVGVPEDHVCGSAHCMLTPYWAEKLGQGGKEMSAKQVSERGGDIRTAWREAEETITLSGQARTVLTGEILL